MLLDFIMQRKLLIFYKSLIEMRATIWKERGKILLKSNDAKHRLPHVTKSQVSTSRNMLINE